MAEENKNGYVPRLKVQYDTEIRPALATKFGLNIMAVPRLEKIVVNMGVGDVLREPKAMEGAVADLMVITGQKPVVIKSRKAISNFKLREGVNIGAKVTLRGAKAWEFLDRLITLAIPRIRDFRGLPTKGFDGRGNYTFGVTDQTIFPEIDFDKIMKIRGMDISIVTTATDNEGGRALLDAFGFPFRKN
jgi:large subunit ribosomal protein L5